MWYTHTHPHAQWDDCIVFKTRFTLQFLLIKSIDMFDSTTVFGNNEEGYWNKTKFMPHFLLNIVYFAQNILVAK